MFGTKNCTCGANDYWGDDFWGESFGNRRMLDDDYLGNMNDNLVYSKKHPKSFNKGMMTGSKSSKPPKSSPSNNNKITYHKHPTNPIASTKLTPS